MSNGSSVLGEVDLALQGINSALPGLLGVVAMFNPQVAAFMKFLPVIEAAIRGVDTVAQSIGTGNVSAAQAAVVDHLTPGAPNTSALGN